MRAALSGLIAVLFAGCETAPTERPRKIPPSVIQHALESLSSGQTIRWRDRLTGESGSIAPIRTFRTSGGPYCRDYLVTFETPEGVEVSWTQTACRTAEAVWEAI